MQQLTQAGAASTPGYALHVGEERKMAAHAEACRSVGVLFVPIVAETLGGWSEVAIDTIKSIGRLQGQRLGIPPHTYIPVAVGAVFRYPVAVGA